MAEQFHKKIILRHDTAPIDTLTIDIIKKMLCFA